MSDDYQGTMLCDRGCFLYDEDSRTFYAALADHEGPPKAIGIPSASPQLPPKFFYINEAAAWATDRWQPPSNATVYTTDEINPYYILLYNDMEVMRRHWKICRMLAGKDRGATASYSIV
jgi:hypothetical protein